MRNFIPFRYKGMSCLLDCLLNKPELPNNYGNHTLLVLFSDFFLSVDIRFPLLYLMLNSLSSKCVCPGQVSSGTQDTVKY